VDVSECSAKPNSKRSRRLDTAKAAPSPSAKRSNTATLVRAGSADQSSSVSYGWTSGAASSAGPALRAASSLAVTRSGTSAADVTERVTTPALGPAAPSKIEMTVTDRDAIWPLVVRLFAAHRRLVSVCSLPTTMQPSALERVSTRSTRSCIGIIGHLPPLWKGR